jgi:hypothetical protein
MAECRHSAHAVYDLKYHLIWTITNSLLRDSQRLSLSGRHKFAYSAVSNRVKVAKVNMLVRIRIENRGRIGRTSGFSKRRRSKNLPDQRTNNLKIIS